jgi:glycine cleavage system H protein
VSYDDKTGLGTITITEYAQSSLGDVVFVELPVLETKVEQGGELCSETILCRKSR